MKHNHSCECEHANVQYCKKCKVVHCLDCNMEWKAYPSYPYNYPYNYPYWQYGQYNYPNGVYNSQLTAGGSSAGQASTISNQMQATVAACNHGAS